jgi:hypothetical protein
MRKPGEECKITVVQFNTTVRRRTLIQRRLFPANKKPLPVLPEGAKGPKSG